MAWKYGAPGVRMIQNGEFVVFFFFAIFCPDHPRSRAQSEMQQQASFCRICASGTIIFQQNRESVRSWPLQFCSMVLSGLLMGAREFAIYGMATIAAQGALAGIWFMGGVQDLQLSETQLEPEVVTLQR